MTLAGHTEINCVLILWPSVLVFYHRLGFSIHGPGICLVTCYAQILFILHIALGSDGPALRSPMHHRGRCLRDVSTVFGISPSYIKLDQTCRSHTWWLGNIRESGHDILRSSRGKYHYFYNIATHRWSSAIVHSVRFRYIAINSYSIQSLVSYVQVFSSVPSLLPMSLS